MLTVVLAYGQGSTTAHADGETDSRNMLAEDNHEPNVVPFVAGNDGIQITSRREEKQSADENLLDDLLADDTATLKPAAKKSSVGVGSPPRSDAENDEDLDDWLDSVI